jgi:HD-GYP domain-containing protein (c-di-GMP phosphodiesterase class II)
MLRVDIEHVREGMELAMPVRHPYRPKSQLLAAGCALRGNTIHRLRELKVGHVWIRCPQLEALEQYYTPGLVNAHAQLVEGACHGIEQFLVMTKKRSPRVDLGAFERTAIELHALYARDLDHAVFLPALTAGPNELVRHAVDVTTLSLLTAIRMQYELDRERREQGLDTSKTAIEIALGAMLHDIGLFAGESGPRALDIAAHESPDEAWLEHPWIGHRLVKGQVSDSVAMIVLHHHQHFDGSGYPLRASMSADDEGLDGERIPIYARIVTACDVFDELRQTSPDGPLTTGQTLARLVQKPYRTWFQPTVHQALTESVTVFAPGAFVTLSNGESGYVVAHHPESVAAPVVQVVDQATLGQSCPAAALPTYDLATETDLRIVDVNGLPVDHDAMVPGKSVSGDGRDDQADGLDQLAA